MSILSPTQIYNLARSVGFSVSSAIMATAIALAESGGNTDARGVNTDGSIDRGLWQINNKWHPDVSDVCAYDATCNAENAFKISSGGTNWYPWSTYTNGAYKNYLSEAQQIAGTGGTTSTSGTSGTAPTSGTLGTGTGTSSDSLGTDLAGILVGIGAIGGGILIFAFPALKKIGKIAAKGAMI